MVKFGLEFGMELEYGIWNWSVEVGRSFVEGTVDFWERKHTPD
jgi:hypothetical protein